MCSSLWKEHRKKKTFLRDDYRFWRAIQLNNIFVGRGTGRRKGGGRRHYLWKIRNWRLKKMIQWMGVVIPFAKSQDLANNSIFQSRNAAEWQKKDEPDDLSISRWCAEWYPSQVEVLPDCISVCVGQKLKRAQPLFFGICRNKLWLVTQKLQKGSIFRKANLQELLSNCQKKFNLQLFGCSTKNVIRHLSFVYHITQYKHTDFSGMGTQ